MVKLEARLEAKAEAAKVVMIAMTKKRQNEDSAVAVAMATCMGDVVVAAVVEGCRWRRLRQQPCGKVDRPAG